MTSAFFSISNFSNLFQASTSTSLAKEWSDSAIEVVVAAIMTKKITSISGWNSSVKTTGPEVLLIVRILVLQDLVSYIILMWFYIWYHVFLTVPLPWYTCFKARIIACISINCICLLCKYLTTSHKFFFCTRLFSTVLSQFLLI